MDLHQAYPDVFSGEEAAHLSSLLEPPRGVGPRQRIARSNERLTTALFLDQGFAARYRSNRTGQRQFLSLHIPGDFVDLPSYVLGRLDHDLDAITEVSLRPIPHAGLKGLRASSPETLDKLWRVSLLDTAIHRYWIFRLGRLPGRARIANFLCEMLLRQYVRGLCTTERFDLPITQTDLGEACGITPVHANRMIGELREEGICTFSNGVVTVADFRGLLKTGQFSWDYLFLPGEVEMLLKQQLTGTDRNSVSGLTGHRA